MMMSPAVWPLVSGLAVTSLPMTDTTTAGTMSKGGRKPAADDEHVHGAAHIPQALDHQVDSLSAGHLDAFLAGARPCEPARADNDLLVQGLGADEIHQEERPGPHGHDIPHGSSRPRGGRVVRTGDAGRTMALHFAHECPFGAGELEGGGIVARTHDQGPGKELADPFV
jgi:hypothetical protein